MSNISFEIKTINKKKTLTHCYVHDGFIDVEVPSDVEVIGCRAFVDDNQYWHNIRNIILPEGLKEIGVDAITCGAIKSIKIPNSVEIIDKYAFSGCSSLEEVVLPEGLVEIRRGLFNECTALKRIVFPNSVRIISMDAFYECNALEELVLPERLKELPATFINYKGLKRIVIPDKAEGVYKNASSGCDFIKTISIPLKRKEEGKYVVKYKSLVKIISRRTTTESCNNCSVDCEKIDRDYEHIVVKNGELISFCSFKEDITLPEGIVSIREDSVIAFFAKKITLPNSVKEVYEKAFLINDNSLKTLCLPKILSKKLISPLPCVEEYEVSPESKRFKAVDGVVYSIDMKKLIKYPQKKKDKEFIVPSGVKEIASEAFQCCFYLERIVLPEGIENIGSSAFEGICVPYIVIPKTADTIARDALRYCYRLWSRHCFYSRLDLKYIYDDTYREAYERGIHDRLFYVPRAVFYKLSQVDSLYKAQRIYLGGDLTDLPGHLRREATAGFFYALRNGLDEILQFKDSYIDFLKRNINKWIPYLNYLFDKNEADFRIHFMMDEKIIPLKVVDELLDKIALYENDNSEHNIFGSCNKAFQLKAELLDYKSNMFKNDLDDFKLYDDPKVKMMVRMAERREEIKGYKGIKGIVFACSGDLPRFRSEHNDYTGEIDRSELIDYIESHGGIYRTSVSSKTDYLICDNPNSDSNKCEKARELEIPIISEDEFIKMAEETN